MEKYLFAVSPMTSVQTLFSPHSPPELLLLPLLALKGLTYSLLYREYGPAYSWLAMHLGASQLISTYHLMLAQMVKIHLIPSKISPRCCSSASFLAGSPVYTTTGDLPTCSTGKVTTCNTVPLCLLLQQDSCPLSHRVCSYSECMDNHNDMLSIISTFLKAQHAWLVLNLPY